MCHRLFTLSSLSTIPHSILIDTQVTRSIFLTAELSVHEELYTNWLSMSTSLVIFALLPVTSDAVVGISHSMALSVALLVELMVRTDHNSSAGQKPSPSPSPSPSH